MSDSQPCRTTWSWRAALTWAFVWWLSYSCVMLLFVGIYGAFYAWYVPTRQFSAPLALCYASTQEPGPQYPVKGTAVLPCGRKGVRYDISLVLEVANFPNLSERVGNFMVASQLLHKLPVDFTFSRPDLNCGSATFETASVAEIDQAFANYSEKVQQSEQATLLPYSSRIISSIRTTVFALPILLGAFSESFTHRVFLARQIEHAPSDSRWAAMRVFISTREVPVMSARIEVAAHFTGLRYAMFYWRWATFGGYVLGAAFLSSVIATVFVAVIYFRWFKIRRVDTLTAELDSNTLSNDSSQCNPRSNNSMSFEQQRCDNAGPLEERSFAVPSMSRRLPVRLSAASQKISKDGLDVDGQANLSRMPNGNAVSDTTLAEDTDLNMDDAEQATIVNYIQGGSDGFAETSGSSIDSTHYPHHVSKAGSIAHSNEIAVYSPQSSATVESTDNVFLPDPDIEGAILDGQFPAFGGDFESENGHS